MTVNGSNAKSWAIARTIVYVQIPIVDFTIDPIPIFAVGDDIVVHIHERQGSNGSYEGNN